MYTFFLCFSFVHACAARRLCLCPCVANVHTCGWQPRTRAQDLACGREEISGSFPSTSNSYFPPLFITCSHLPFSYLGLSCFIPLPLPPLLCLSWPGFHFLPLKSTLHLCAVTSEQKQLRTSQRSIKNPLFLSSFLFIFHLCAVLGTDSISHLSFHSFECPQLQGTWSGVSPSCKLCESFTESSVLHKMYFFFQTSHQGKNSRQNRRMPDAKT